MLRKCLKVMCFLVTSTLRFTECTSNLLDSFEPFSLCLLRLMSL